MLVDIHTHSKEKSSNLSIQSLDYSEIEEAFVFENNSFYSIGFHPWYAQKFTTEQFTKLEKFVAFNEILAIGECGLDKNCITELKLQISIFEKQLELAERVGKPLIIHCVGCFNELISIRKSENFNQPWIIHGFRGKPQLANQLLNAGFSLSYGEFFNTESLKLTPTDRLFVETDESKLELETIYQHISAQKNCTIDKLNAGILLFQKN